MSTQHIENEGRRGEEPSRLYSVEPPSSQAEREKIAGGAGRVADKAKWLAELVNLEFSEGITDEQAAQAYRLLVAERCATCCSRSAWVLRHERRAADVNQSALLFSGTRAANVTDVDECGDPNFKALVKELGDVLSFGDPVDDEKPATHMCRKWCSQEFY